MENKELAKHARAFLRAKGAYVHAGRGRTDRACGIYPSIPVKILDGESEPTLCGLPHWKTGFSRNGFSKVLYTPSTLRVEVGLNWNPYNNDNH